MSQDFSICPTGASAFRRKFNVGDNVDDQSPLAKQSSSDMFRVRDHRTSFTRAREPL
jgi:hypothetical protein